MIYKFKLYSSTKVTIILKMRQKKQPNGWKFFKLKQIITFYKVERGFRICIKNLYKTRRPQWKSRREEL